MTQVKEGETIRIYAADGRIDGMVKQIEHTEEREG